MIYGRLSFYEKRISSHPIAKPESTVLDFVHQAVPLHFPVLEQTI